MPTCRICLKSVKQLRFDTSRTAVCGRCVRLPARPGCGWMARPTAQRSTMLHGKGVQWLHSLAKECDGYTALLPPDGYARRLSRSALAPVPARMDFSDWPGRGRATPKLDALTLSAGPNGS